MAERFVAVVRVVRHVPEIHRYCSLKFKIFSLVKKTKSLGIADTLNAMFFMFTMFETDSNKVIVSLNAMFSMFTMFETDSK